MDSSITVVFLSVRTSFVISVPRETEKPVHLCPMYNNFCRTRFHSDTRQVSPTVSNAPYRREYLITLFVLVEPSEIARPTFEHIE